MEGDGEGTEGVRTPAADRIGAPKLNRFGAGARTPHDTRRPKEDTTRMPHPSHRRALGAASLLTGLALAASAAPAHAATVGLAGGATSLKLTPKTASVLHHLGVQVSPTGAARVRGRAVAFPITGGRIDPATAAGVIRHRGGLRLKAGHVSVNLSRFVVRTTKPSSVSAKVNGGKRLRAFVPVLGRARITRNGLATTVRRVDLHLSTPAARALNRAFGVHAFRGRLKLGTVVIKAKPSQVAFKGGATSLTLDPAAAAALSSLGVTPGVSAPATANPDGSLSFPITGGRVNLKSLAGSITHSGGITLTAGSLPSGVTVVSLADFTINTRTKQLTATINGGARAAILDLDLSAPAVAVKGRRVTVGNVGASLTQGAADALNGAFGVTAFTAGLKLGTATVVGRGA